MYTTDKLFQITGDEIDRALSALVSIVNRNTEAAQLLRAIKARSGCVGRVFNASRVPEIQAILPGYRVSYSISDYIKRRPRNLHIIRLDDHGQPMGGPTNHWSFELASAEYPRLTADHLDGLIAYYTAEAHETSGMAAELPMKAAAYNAAAAYLQPIKRTVDTIMLHAGI